MTAVIWWIVIWVGSMLVAELVRPKVKYDDPPVAGVEDLTVPTAEEGRPISVLYGTVKLESPNVVWYGNLQSYENKDYAKTGLWTTTKVVKGYYYYLDMHMVLCSGPLDAIEAILFQDDLAWAGEAIDQTEILVNAEFLFGGSDSGGGAKGPIDVMFGHGTQPVNQWLLDRMSQDFVELGPGGDTATPHIPGSGIDPEYIPIWDARQAELLAGIDYSEGTLDSILRQNEEIQILLSAEYAAWKANKEGGGDLQPDGTYTGGYSVLTSQDLVPAFRGVSSLVFKSFYFGTSAYIPPIKIVCRRHVDGLGSGAYSKLGDTGRDCNPIEILYDVMHNSEYGMGIPGYRFDKSSYLYAARLLFEEGFGMSYKIGSLTNFETIIGDILRHIEAVQYISPITGLETIKLIRQDYSATNLLSFDEDNILELVTFTRGTWDETINEIKVNFVERENNYKTGTVIEQDNANLQMQGQVFSSTVAYNGIYDRVLAQRVAKRDLKNKSIPLAHVEMRVNREGYGILPGDVVEFSWGDFNILSMLLRVQKVNYGGSGDSGITVHAVQEVSAVGLAEFYIPAGATWDALNIDPGKILIAEGGAPLDYMVANEAPYFLVFDDAELGLDTTDGKYWPIGASSGQNYLFDVFSRIPPETVYSRWEQSYPVSYHLKVNYPVTQYAESIEVVGVMPVSTTSQDFGNLWRNMIQVGGEIMAFSEIHDNGNGSYLLGGVIWRGIGDTVPLPHAVGSDVWVFGAFVPKTDQVFNETDTVELTYIAQGPNVGDTISPTVENISLTFQARAYRPYPPGNFRIDGDEFPTAYIESDPVALTWSHRTRLQNGVLVDNSDTANYGPEVGTTYNLRIYDENDVLIRTETGLTGTAYNYSNAQELIDSGRLNTQLTLRLDAERDGYTSWQHQFRVIYRVLGSASGGFGAIYGDSYGEAYDSSGTPGTVPGVVVDPEQSTDPLLPVGTDPDPDGVGGPDDAVSGTGPGWELQPGEYAPSRMAAEIMNPRPLAEQNDRSRYRWTHTSLPYEVPVSVMGGAPPFQFTISGTAGATIQKMAPGFNPYNFSWAVVSLPAGAEGSITVAVYDQEHRTSPAATVSWTVTKKDAKFLFLDKSNGSAGNPGTFVSPKRDIEDWYKGSRSNTDYANRICVYRTGTYIPDNDPAPATWDNVMHLSANKPLSHIGFPGEAATWDFGQGPAYQGMSDNPGGNIEDLFFANLRLYRGQCHARFWYFSERHVWWDMTFEAPDINAWDESNIGGIIYLKARHTHISATDLEMKNFPSKAVNTAGFEAYSIVSAAIDGVIGNNFKASTLVYMKAKTFRATVTNCSQWTDGDAARGPFYSTASWYGSQMVGFDDTDGDNSLLQLRYCRGYMDNDDGDGFLLASQLAYKIRGKRYADRVVSVTGAYEPGLSNTVFLGGSLFVNDRSPTIPTKFTVDGDTRDYTRAQFAANTDASGSLTDGDRYTVGYLVNEPAAAPDPDPEVDPPGPIGVVGITDLDQILWASQHDGAISWDNAIDGRPLADYTSVEDAPGAVFSIDIAPLADVAHVVRQDLSEGQTLQVGYDHSGLIPWAGIQLRRGDSYWVRQALYFPDGTEGLTHANGGAVPAFSFEPHATILDENYPADQAIWLERLGQYNASGGKIGDLVFGLETSGAGADISFLMEGGDQDWQSALTAGAAIPRGQWVMFEGQIVLDDKIASQGGAPAVRVWINGTLVVDRDDIRTMIEGGTSNLFYNRTFIGEWAGLVPQDQTLFFATPAIAVDIAGVRTDSDNLADDPAGNPYLGMRVIPDFLVPTQGFSIHIDAEQGTVGLQDIEGSASNQLTWLMESTVSDTHVFRGSKSIHCYRTGLPVYPDQGWGEWGVKKDFTPVKKGGTIHFQVSVYFPAGFDFTADPWLKFMRLHHRGTGGEHQGFHDLYIRNDTFTPDDAYGQMHLAGEVVTGNHLLVGQIMQTGVWETFEIGIVVDNVAKDSGGSAAVRVWRKVNGVMRLVIEKTSYKTLVVADGDINNAMVFGGTWNTTSDGEPWPKTTQEAWLDDFKVETDLTKMTQTDSAGNKIIGL